MGRTAEQRAKNESTFREANEKLEDKVVELSLTEERTPYLCECDDIHCTAIIRLTMPEGERRGRLQAICEQVREHDVAAWIEAQLADLDHRVAGVS